MCSDKHSGTLTAMKQGAGHPTTHRGVPISLNLNKIRLGATRKCKQHTQSEYSCNRQNKTPHKTNTHKPPSLCCIAWCTCWHVLPTGPHDTAGSTHNTQGRVPTDAHHSRRLLQPPTP